MLGLPFFGELQYITVVSPAKSFNAAGLTAEEERQLVPAVGERWADCARQRFPFTGALQRSHVWNISIMIGVPLGDQQ